MGYVVTNSIDMTIGNPNLTYGIFCHIFAKDAIPSYHAEWVCDCPMTQMVLTLTGEDLYNQIFTGFVNE